MSFLKVIVLAIVQGLAELLPVSSSAHVVVAAKLMGRPLVLQEQNSIPGLANRVLSHVADEVHLSFL